MRSNRSAKICFCPFADLPSSLIDVRFCSQNERNPPCTLVRIYQSMF